MKRKELKRDEKRSVKAVTSSNIPDWMEIRLLEYKIKMEKSEKAIYDNYERNR